MTRHPHILIERIATPEQWRKIVGRLERLDFPQVRMLATRLGLEFTDVSQGGVKKEDYINVLDESHWDDFEREYDRIARSDSRTARGASAAGGASRSLARRLFELIDASEAPSEIADADATTDRGCLRGRTS